jgi:tetratricopeptide (TPR) repeat protein
VIEMLLQADRLLTVDLVDQADAIYQRVAEQDPRNAIAVVGMARCALARGEDQEAYRLAARALDIDPENDMARRMTARMAEVLAYRGETPEAAAPETPEAPEPVAQAPAPVAATPSTSSPSSTTRTTAPASRSWLDRIRGR